MSDYTERWMKPFRNDEEYNTFIREEVRLKTPLWREARNWMALMTAASLTIAFLLGFKGVGLSVEVALAMAAGFTTGLIVGGSFLMRGAYLGRRANPEDVTVTLELNEAALGGIE
jgi:hypothetical protein